MKNFNLKNVLENKQPWQLTEIKKFKLKYKTNYK